MIGRPKKTPKGFPCRVGSVQASLSGGVGRSFFRPGGEFAPPAGPHGRPGVRWRSSSGAGQPRSVIFLSVAHGELTFVTAFLHCSWHVLCFLFFLFFGSFHFYWGSAKNKVFSYHTKSRDVLVSLFWSILSSQGSKGSSSFIWCFGQV